MKKAPAVAPKNVRLVVFAIIVCSLCSPCRARAVVNVAFSSTSVDYINAMFGESFIELHGDRNYSDDKAVVGGVGMLNNIPVTVIGLEKGRNTFERM